MVWPLPKGMELERRESKKKRNNKSAVYEV